jgi:hypothetical protein
LARETRQRFICSCGSDETYRQEILTRHGAHRSFGAGAASPRCPTPQKAASDIGNLHSCRIAKNVGSDKVLEATTKIWAVRTSASCRTAIYEALGHAGGQILIVKSRQISGTVGAQCYPRTSSRATRPSRELARRKADRKFILGSVSRPSASRINCSLNQVIDPKPLMALMMVMGE